MEPLIILIMELIANVFVQKREDAAMTYSTHSNNVCSLFAIHLTNHVRVILLKRTFAHAI